MTCHFWFDYYYLKEIFLNALILVVILLIPEDCVLDFFAFNNDFRAEEEVDWIEPCIYEHVGDIVPFLNFPHVATKAFAAVPE